MDQLIIDRNTWLRGEGTDTSRLLRPSDGKMCCLGFDMLRRGYSAERITNLHTPGQVDMIPGLTIEAPMSFDMWHTTDLCQQLMTWNDAVVEADCTNNDHVDGECYNEEHVDDEADREARITKLFAELNIEVVFVN